MLAVHSDEYLGAALMLGRRYENGTAERWEEQPICPHAKAALPLTGYEPMCTLPYMRETSSSVAAICVSSSIPRRKVWLRKGLTCESPVSTPLIAAHFCRSRCGTPAVTAAAAGQAYGK